MITLSKLLLSDVLISTTHSELTRTSYIVSFITKINEMFSWCGYMHHLAIAMESTGCEICKMYSDSCECRYTDK